MQNFPFNEIWERVTSVTGWKKLGDLAEHLNIKQSSVSGAKNKRDSFPIEWAFNISQSYNCSTDWLLTGEGSMHKGDEAASTQGMAAPPRSAAQGQDITPMPYDNIGFGESVELLSKIYNSDNPVLIRAIAANLHAFSEAIDNKTLAVNTVNMMKQMDTRMTAMEQRLADAEVLPKKMANG